MNEKFILLTTGIDSPKPVIIGLSNIEHIIQSSENPELTTVFFTTPTSNGFRHIKVNESFEQIKKMLNL